MSARTYYRPYAEFEGPEDHDESDGAILEDISQVTSRQRW